MIKKIKIILVCFFVIIFSACSCSKQELIEQNIELKEENDKLLKETRKYKDIEQIFSFYNKLTLEVINSFVLVQSKNMITSNSLYSDGVVIASNGYNYYVLTDYNAIKQPGKIEYKVMDSNGNVYKSQIAEVYDDYTGFVLLEMTVLGYSNTVVKSINLGEKSELVAHISSIDQINKIQLSENIKTSTISYNDTSYSTYNIENIDVNNGSLINTNSQLCGFYSSNVDGLIDYNLIKTILYTIYSLTL